MQWKRILVKLSGEVFGSESTVFDHTIFERFAYDISLLTKKWLEVVVICGAWNVRRWKDTTHLPIDRVKSDYLGMLWWVMNNSILSEMINAVWVKSMVMTTEKLNISPLTTPYNQLEGRVLLEQWAVICCAWGVWSPYFTHDTAAVLRALELECDIVVKATKVDGIYSADPNKDPNATRYDTITYEEALQKNIKVMDQSAIGMAKEEWMPLYVCHFETLSTLLDKWHVGTLVTPKEI